MLCKEILCPALPAKKNREERKREKEKQRKKNGNKSLELVSIANLNSLIKVFFDE